MSKKAKIWIITGDSESGDHYGPDVFDHEPTAAEISAWCHNCDGHFGEPDEDWEPGPGFDGSFVYPTVTAK